MLEHRTLVPLAVRGIAHRARRAHADALGVERSRATAIRREHVHRALQGVRGDPAGLVHTASEARDDHVARELVEAATAVGLGDEEPDRVRALVDRGDTARSLVMDRLDLDGHPCPDRVLTAREMVRVVRVEALHAGARPADAAPRASLGQRRGALGRIRLVCRHEGASEPLVDLGPVVQAADRALRLDARDRLHGGRTGQPEQGRERMPTRAHRVVPDHERMALGAACDDRERCGGIASELLADEGEIAAAELAHGGRYLRLCSTERLKST